MARQSATGQDGGPGDGSRLAAAALVSSVQQAAEKCRQIR
jgi:hypothetical protein